MTVSFFYIMQNDFIGLQKKVFNNFGDNIYFNYFNLILITIKSTRAKDQMAFIFIPLGCALLGGVIGSVISS